MALEPPHDKGDKPGDQQARCEHGEDRVNPLEDVLDARAGVAIFPLLEREAEAHDESESRDGRERDCEPRTPCRHDRCEGNARDDRDRPRTDLAHATSMPSAREPATRAGSVFADSNDVTLLCASVRKCSLRPVTLAVPLGLTCVKRDTWDVQGRSPAALAVFVGLSVAAFVTTGCGSGRHSGSGSRSTSKFVPLTAQTVKLRSCGFRKFGKGWYLYASRPAGCVSARVTFRRYFAQRCNQGAAGMCSVGRYRCGSSFRDDVESVDCVAGTRAVVFHSLP